jgi:hypothetical protein
MSKLKIDIPDIRVILDKGDNYNVIINRPSSVVRQVTGSIFSSADFAFTANTASYVDLQNVDGFFEYSQSILEYINSQTGSTNFTGDVTVTGSVITTTGFTGSLLGTSSVALTVLQQEFTGSFSGSLFGTASYALDAGLLNGFNSDQFATTSSNVFIGDQEITGSVSITAGDLIVTGSVGIVGNTEISGNLEVSSDGLLVLYPRETPDFVTGGIFFSSSGEFYVGIGT